VRTPRLHQPHLLWEPSSMTKASLPKSHVTEWPPLIGNGFGLRCFQPLSTTAWLPGKCPIGQPVNQRLQSPVPLVLGTLSPQATNPPSR